MPIHMQHCHVLVVEDDAVLVDMLLPALRDLGMTVEHAGSAGDAVRRIGSRRPAIIVCAARLPDGDAGTMLRAVRADPNLATVQVVLMAGADDALPPRAGMDLGANDYLAKPFTREAFESCIVARCRQAAVLARIEQRSIERMRGTVTAVLPHEFFTPLAGIIGLSELLREDGTNMSTEQCRECLEEIGESAQRLRRSMENYLEILRLREHHGSDDYELLETPLSDLLPAFASAADEAAARHQRNDDLKVECSVSGEHGLLRVDGARLAKIVFELVDNACKFSEQGTPVVARLEAVNGKLRLAVEDVGRGMESEEISQVGAFRQFHRDRFEQQGLGLGLTLAQYLVDATGGTCRIRSRRGAGTTVEATWTIRWPSPAGESED